MNKHLAARLSNLPLKHLGSYIVQIFVHIFALYVGAGVTCAFLNDDVTHRAEGTAETIAIMHVVRGTLTGAF